MLHRAALPLLALVLIVVCLSCIPIASASVAPEKAIHHDLHGLKEDERVSLLKQIELISPSIKNKEDAPLTSEWLKQHHERVLRLVQALGYFDARVTTRWTQEAPGRYTVRYWITPGAAYQLKSIDLHIPEPLKSLSETQKYLKDCYTMLGHTVNIDRYQRQKQQLYELAEKNGFLKAHFKTHRLILNRKKHTARIVWDLELDRQYFIGATSFSQTPFDASFLKRLIPYPEGMPYDEQMLLDFQNDLSSSRYFQEVHVVGLRDRAQQGMIPVELQLKAAPPQSYQAGLGYGTDTGARLSLGWNMYWLNRLGHSAQTMLYLSENQNMLQSSYQWPGQKPLTDQSNIFLNLTKGRWDSGQSSVAQLGYSYTQKLKNDWQRILGLKFQNERSKATSDVSFDRDFSMIPSVSFQKTQGNHPIFPTEGYRMQYTLQGASPWLIADNSFLQIIAQAKWAHFWGHDWRTLIRGDLGWSLGSAQSELPLSLRFYAGGTQSVRGYSFASLGPGRYLVASGLDLQRRVHGDWFAGVHYDAGNAFQRLPLLLKRSYGFSAIWMSPIGSMSMGLSRGIDQARPAWKIQITMGPEL